MDHQHSGSDTGSNPAQSRLHAPECASRDVSQHGRLTSRLLVRVPLSASHKPADAARDCLNLSLTSQGSSRLPEGTASCTAAQMKHVNLPLGFFPGCQVLLFRIQTAVSGDYGLTEIQAAVSLLTVDSLNRHECRNETVECDQCWTQRPKPVGHNADQAPWGACAPVEQQSVLPGERPAGLHEADSAREGRRWLRADVLSILHCALPAQMHILAV